jgi:hypothetical protein
LASNSCIFSDSKAFSWMKKATQLLLWGLGALMGRAEKVSKVTKQNIGHLGCALVIN